MNAIRRCTGLVAALFSIFFHPTAAAGQFSSVYAFGDGVCTTTGNNSSTPSLYFGNRYCNGRVFIERLTEDWQGLTYYPGRNKSYFGQDSNDLLNNIDDFSAPGNVATALFIVWVANADFVEFSQTSTPPYTNADKPAWTTFIEESVARHKQAINKLYNKGVRTLVMPNAVDISATPYYDIPASDSSFIRSRASQFNTLFKAEMIAHAATKSGLTLYLPNTFKFFEDVLANPSAFGMINPQVGGHSIDAITHLGNPGLNGPGANYVFWDYTHPTAKFQMHLAELIQDMIDIPPAVTLQPVSNIINSGTSTTLSVAFSGTSPAIQWYRGSAGDTSNPVSGATSPTLTTPVLTANTNYWARATNSQGSADSNTATITIRIAPAITTQPESVIIASGSPAIINVTASGTSPTFQWYLGNPGVTTDPVPGATDSTFTTPPLTSTTTYWVRASNLAGTADSNAATVTIATAFNLWQNDQFTLEDLANPLISGPDADPDGDGLSNDQEYLFGLLPLTGNPSPSPATSLSGNQLSLTFIATLATGPGYAGLTRRYTLESSPALNGSAWTPLPGYTDIPGNGQTVIYTVPATQPHAFYRLAVRLVP